MVAWVDQDTEDGEKTVTSATDRAVGRQDFGWWLSAVINTSSLNYT